MNNEDRYCQLNGDPIHTPLKSAFLRATDVVYPCLLTAFTAAVTMPHNPDMATNIAVNGIVGMLFGATFGRLVEYATSNVAILMNNSRFDGCIDKAPDQFTPPQKPEHWAIAIPLVVSFGFGALTQTYGAISLLREAASAFQSPETFVPVALLNVIRISDFPNLIRYGSAAHRFYKVAKGDWAMIDDMPEKKKQQEEAPAPGALKPAPIAVS